MFTDIRMNSHLRLWLSLLKSIFLYSSPVKFSILNEMLDEFASALRFPFRGLKDIKTLFVTTTPQAEIKLTVPPLSLIHI